MMKNEKETTVETSIGNSNDGILLHELQNKHNLLMGKKDLIKNFSRGLQIVKKKKNQMEI